jgi:dihydrofolate reductase
MEKSEIILIAAVDTSFAIGNDNDLIIKSKGDMKHFKETTTGHSVIMGRKTLESMGSYLLPQRYNVILTNKNPDDIKVKVCKADKDKNIKDLVTTGNFEQLLEQLSDKSTKLGSAEKVFIIGGAKTYEAFMPYADKLIITHFDVSVDKADTYFPHIDMSRFSVQHSETKQLDNELGFLEGHILTYVRVNSPIN